ncbi:hypothetical protein ANI_1_1518124 [Paecilomyces variotii No. 5]|uniref:ATP-grasp domain-containing protein n=1 Tax=Byssochlamys spectabilis (strain No. 5 / NBRC 109023) TaxID=1356009 RepID=V5I1W9_BYSSN|nr:hypothetical protein ANI_1_1518124 [Paecilomyces variotii No. 5]
MNKPNSNPQTTGYQDSGADIAYTLRQRGISVLTPQLKPSPFVQEGWCFSDTPSGILSALQRGATHLWANTILFASHPLQTASELDPWESRVHVVGQPPSLVENFDDKAYLNGKLRDSGGFTLPRSWLVRKTSDLDEDDGLETVLRSITRYPIVGKPVRGRGSHGVKVCRDESQLREHVLSLFEESPIVMLEEFLAGEEATVTVMPPSDETPRYWSLPPVARFSHQDGIAPYNGVVAVTQNSRVVTEEEMQKDRSYRKVMKECERVAEVIKATAPIRIDVIWFLPLFDITYFACLSTASTGSREPSQFDSNGGRSDWMGLWYAFTEHPALFSDTRHIQAVSESFLEANSPHIIL